MDDNIFELFRTIASNGVPRRETPETKQTKEWSDNFLLHEMKVGLIEFDEKGRIVA